MTLTRKHPSRPSRRCRDDSGAALIEFTFVAVLLLLLVFGIINFGLTLSFKQDMTRAAAEGARAGAVAFPVADSFADAEEITEIAIDEAGRTCGVDGMQCNINRHACGTTVPSETPSNASSVGDCVTVEVVYTFDDDDTPLGVPIPLISELMPDQITARSVAKVNE